MMAISVYNWWLNQIHIQLITTGYNNCLFNYFFSYSVNVITTYWIVNFLTDSNFYAKSLSLINLYNVNILCLIN